MNLHTKSSVIYLLRKALESSMYQCLNSMSDDDFTTANLQLLKSWQMSTFSEVSFEKV